MDVLTKEQRRKNMQAIRSKGTKMEVALGKALWARGYRFRKNDKSVFGKPDITFKKLKIAIFIDSEYFHGKDWEINKLRISTNREFWWKKIESNIRRDEKVNEYLKKEGWNILRYWSNDIKNNLLNCVGEIENIIRKNEMPIKYSEIKKRLNIEIDNKTDNRLAYLTHTFQNKDNVTKTYPQQAEKYLAQIHKELNIAAEPSIEYYLPIKWDIPFPPAKNPKFKFIDLFAGIGGIRLAYQNLGGQCVFTSEWNKYSKITYEANFGEVPFDDITKISEKEIPDHDILLAGFPCQPFSIAGVSKKNALGRKHGFLDETQGTLFFDIVRIIKYKRPPVFMLENVKNLVSHDKGNTFKVITESLKELNYNYYYKVLDGKHFVPQHRERIIIVGFDNDVFKLKENFEFPKLPEIELKIKDILEPEPLSKYTLTDHLWRYLQEYAEKHKAKGNGFGFGLTDLNGISRTLSARYYKDGAEILIPQEGKNPRRLTPRECARLQGFPEEFSIPVSDAQAYKQFGNSVIVPLIHAVGKNIVKQLLLLNES